MLIRFSYSQLFMNLPFYDLHVSRAYFFFPVVSYDTFFRKSRWYFNRASLFFFVNSIQMPPVIIPLIPVSCLFFTDTLLVPLPFTQIPYPYPLPPTPNPDRYGAVLYLYISTPVWAIPSPLTALHCLQAPIQVILPITKYNHFTFCVSK